VRLTTIASLHETVRSARRAGSIVGLVPTMGALHDGHAELIRRAAAECDQVITTVFVNPLQFGPTEDFAAYPRTLDDDEAIALAAGAHHVFCPSVGEMYPHGSDAVLTQVRVRGITDVLDGVSRPGHFDGVATVVAKLFAMAGECRAYFGEKDFQQLAVIRRMAADLSFPVAVIGVPTVREPNGLARSSRNRYRDKASVIFRALCAGRALVDSGQSVTAGQVGELMTGMLLASDVVDSVDYAVCVDAATFVTPSDVTAAPVRLLIAARVGAARLIDNL
jgi:pantoate--beta-alanine ligase